MKQSLKQQLAEMPSEEAHVEREGRWHAITAVEQHRLSSLDTAPDEFDAYLAFNYAGDTVVEPVLQDRSEATRISRERGEPIWIRPYSYRRRPSEGSTWFGQWEEVDASAALDPDEP